MSFPEDELRAKLNGKWRNQLKKAESYNLELIVDKSNESFRWLLSCYDQMIKEKLFKGTSAKFYSVLQRNNKNNHFIFKVKHLNTLVAGILIILHGKSCVYQIGWNNSEGRKVYANNFLIWYAMLHMKKLECKWFDLGGVDLKNTPGIAKFKNGLKGENYELVGEWVSI